LIDTWLEVRDVEMNGERTRGLYVIKSRGMAHSNQVREFILHDNGISLLDVYPGPDGILTGSARAAEDARQAAEAAERQAAAERSEKALSRRQAALRAQIAALEAEFASDAESSRLGLADSNARAEQERAGRRAAGARRTQAGAGTNSSRHAKEQ
jgi:circadian clock protein KaiC